MTEIQELLVRLRCERREEGARIQNQLELDFTNTHSDARPEVRRHCLCDDLDDIVISRQAIPPVGKRTRPLREDL
jgi:hypothetical protein